MNCETGSCATFYVNADARRFLTREERIHMLSEYKETLENEAKGVAERIAELEKA